jgi:hypothetical protein
MKKLTACAAALAAAAAFTGCTEVAQEPGKSYAGKIDDKPFASDQVKGDKAKWEQTLAARADKQNDYSRAMAEKK